MVFHVMKEHLIQLEKGAGLYFSTRLRNGSSRNPANRVLEIEKGLEKLVALVLE